MPYIVRDLPPIHVTSSASAVTNAIGRLDDASSITLFFTSSFSGSSTAANIFISQFDPGDALTGIQSANSTSLTGWFPLSTATVGQITSSGLVIVLSNVSFRGIKIGGWTSSGLAADTIALASKQISV